MKIVNILVIVVVLSFFFFVSFVVVEVQFIFVGQYKVGIIFVFVGINLGLLEDQLVQKVDEMGVILYCIILVIGLNIFYGIVVIYK